MKLFGILRNEVLESRLGAYDLESGRLMFSLHDLVRLLKFLFCT